MTSKTRPIDWSSPLGQSILNQQAAARAGARRPHEDPLNSMGRFGKLQEVPFGEQVGDYELPYYYCDFRKDIKDTEHNRCKDAQGREFCLLCGKSMEELRICIGLKMSKLKKAEHLRKLAAELEKEANEDSDADPTDCVIIDEKSKQ